MSALQDDAAVVKSFRLLRGHGDQFVVIPLAGGACPSGRAAPTWTPPPASSRSAPVPRTLPRLGLTSSSSAPQPIQPHHPAIAEVIVVLADLDAAANCAAHLLTRPWNGDSFIALPPVSVRPDRRSRRVLRARLRPARPTTSPASTPTTTRVSPPTSAHAASWSGLEPATAKVDAKCTSTRSTRSSSAPARPYSPSPARGQRASVARGPPIAPGPS
jgi:hypothetical protein